MKILFAAVAVMAMAACSNEDVISRPALPMIGFDTFVENSTRAADINADNLANFGVYGSVVNSQGQQGMIFANQEVTKTASGYKYSPAQYWIAGAKYDFVAFAPYQSGADATWTYAPKVATDATDATAAENGTITFDNAKAGANQDLLFAATSCETPETFNKKPDPVGFIFNHMLSRVKFTFTNGTATANNLTFKVTDVVLKSIPAKGKLSVSKPTASTAITTGAWTIVAEDGTFDKDFDDAITATANDNDVIAATASAATTHYYLIPNSATYTVEFNVTLYQAGVNLGTYDRSANVKLELGKGMSYNVKAELNADTALDEPLYPIEFKVDGVENWAEFTDKSATVN